MVTPRTDPDLVLRALSSLLTDLGRTSPGTGLMDRDLTSDLGLDSLALVELTDRISDAAGVVLDDAVLADARTPRDLVRALGAALGYRAGERPPPASAATRPHGEAATGPRSTPGAPVTPTLRADTFSTLVDALAWHVTSHPDQPTIRLLASDPAMPARDVTYGRLDDAARRVALSLASGGLSYGDRVAIMLGTEEAYFAVFLGIVLAGGVPVPLYPPTHRAVLAEQLARLAGILRNAEASLLVTAPRATAVARLLSLQVPSLRKVLTPDELMRRGGPAAGLPTLGPDDVALVQYTSGSTGDPKGVVLTHAQLLANIAAMAAGARVTEGDVVVSWLPLYHDMGLIGMWHAPLVIGIPLVVMSPLTFLARPVRWLEAISTYRGTISAAPSFAYQACSDRIRAKDLTGIDLSSWRLAFNGSEPVSARAIDAFADRFGAIGFGRRAMCPAYGLAEAGVGIAFSPPDRGPCVESISRKSLAATGRATAARPGDPDALTVVGCGLPLPGYELRVADRRGGALRERREGRVLCRGPSLTAGYFANDAATDTLWHHGWLDTGDLGFVDHGELFLTGRAKDVVIRAGCNLHPEDLEEAVRDVDGIREDGAAVFAVADPRHGTERLVVAAESDAREPNQRARLEELIRRRLSDRLGIAPDVVAVLPAGAIRRTPSGKVRRGATRDAFEQGVLGLPPRPETLQLAELAWSGLAPAGRWAASAAGRGLFAGYAWATTLLVALALWATIQLPLPLSIRWRATRAAVRAIASLTGIRVSVQDATLPAPAVVVANHQSFVDAGAVVLASREPLAFVTSTDFQHKPVVGSFLRRLGCVFVARDDPGRAADDLSSLAEHVRRGRSLAIFPEGSITRGAGIRPFHLGAFAVAAAAGCAVVPLAIRGTRGVVRPGSYLPRKGAVTVSAGEPVTPSGQGFAAEAALAEMLRTELATLAAEPLAATTSDRRLRPE